MMALYFEGIPTEIPWKRESPYCCHVIGTTAAIIGGALGGGSILGGILGSNAAQKAASTQAEAIDLASQRQYAAEKEAMALQREQWLKSQENLMPWLQSGQAGLNQLLQGLGIGSLQETESSYTPVDPYATERETLTTKIADLEQKLAGLGERTPSGLWGEAGNATAIALLKASIDSAKKELNSLPEAPGSIDTKSWEVVPGDTSAEGYGDLIRSFGMEDFEKDPGYDFRFDEGQRALERSAAAKGMPFGGTAAKAALQYGQNFASNEYQNAWNRFNTEQANRFNRLASIAGIGQTATAAMNQAGQNYANNAANITLGTAQNIGDLMTQAANARSSGYMGSANAWSNAITGGGNALMNTFLLSKIFG